MIRDYDKPYYWYISGPWCNPATPVTMYAYYSNRWWVNGRLYTGCESKLPWYVTKGLHHDQLHRMRGWHKQSIAEQIIGQERAEEFGRWFEENAKPMPMLTFKEDVQFWKPIPKMVLLSSVEEYNVLLAYGDNVEDLEWLEEKNMEDSD